MRIYLASAGRSHQDMRSIIESIGLKDTIVYSVYRFSATEHLYEVEVTIEELAYISLFSSNLTNELDLWRNYLVELPKEIGCYKPQK